MFCFIVGEKVSWAGGSYDADRIEDMNQDTRPLNSSLVYMAHTEVSELAGNDCHESPKCTREYPSVTR